MWIHYCDYSSQPDIHTLCNDVWTQPLWGDRINNLPEGVYLDESAVPYTFDLSKVTCKACLRLHDALRDLNIVHKALELCYQQLQDQQAMPDDHNDHIYKAALAINPRRIP